MLEESTAVQYLLRRGEIKHARSAVLTLGRVRCGEPGIVIEACVQAIDNLDELDRLIERSVHVKSWQELFDGATPDTPLMLSART